MDLFDKFEKHFLQKLPFVVYNKPNENFIIGLFQKEDSVYLVADFNEKGFVFGSFNGAENILIPEEKAEIFKEVFLFSEIEISKKNNIKDDIKAKINHEVLVKKGIEAIKNQLFSKVVLSRKETIDFVNLNLIATFKKLLNQYPTAFTYCFFHPKIGLWLGAFSEQLLKINGRFFATTALAGTQKWNNSGNVVWKKKEQDEQFFVSDFILSALQNKLENLEISKVNTVKAGNLLHLKTDITGVLKQEADLKNIIQILHPTPAVCGFPKEEAKIFIDENEKYDREFYAGFLGELNKDFITNENKTDLFVNLRCMKIEGTKINFYAGGGITKDSIPEKEWEETVDKIDTMKSCIL
jgi:isochorismate synthase